MKKILFYAISFLFFFNSCSDIYNFSYQNSLSKKKLIKTQKAILYDQNQTDLILTATYINDFEHKNNDTERFIISISSDKTWLYNRDFIITLNELQPLGFKKLSPDNPILKLIPLKNQWKNYYLIEFDHIEDIKLFLSISDKVDRTVKLYFSKKAKYIYQ
jgi:hypothetical protein